MIRDLISQARSILAEFSVDGTRGESTTASTEADDLLIERVSSYLDAFDSWRAVQGVSIEGDLNLNLHKELREELISLQAVHLEVMALTERRKGDLGARLSDVGLRAKALRSYVDHFPSRINITGKRKG